MIYSYNQSVCLQHYLLLSLFISTTIIFTIISIVSIITVTIIKYIVITFQFLP